jgi:hypothetical protein
MTEEKIIMKAIVVTDKAAGAHRIDEAAARHFATIFEQPTDDEGLQIIRHV